MKMAMMLMMLMMMLQGTKMKTKINAHKAMTEGCRSRRGSKPGRAGQDQRSTFFSFATWSFIKSPSIIKQQKQKGNKRKPKRVKAKAKAA